MKIKMVNSNIKIPMKLERDMKNGKVMGPQSLKPQPSTSTSTPTSTPTSTVNLYSGMFRNIQNTKSCGSCGK